MFIAETLGAGRLVRVQLGPSGQHGLGKEESWKTSLGCSLFPRGVKTGEVVLGPQCKAHVVRMCKAHACCRATDVERV